MGLYCAVDLHGDNGFYGIVDESGKRLFSKRMPNDLKTVLGFLAPYREQIDRGVVVESTYNWYWLVDGLKCYRQHTDRTNNRHSTGLRLGKKRWCTM